MALTRMPQAMTVGQLVPGGPVYSVPPTASVKDAAQVMHDRGADAVLVVGADRRPLGLLTAKDIVLRVTNAGRDAASVRADAVMSAPVTAVGQDEDIGQAIALMVHRQMTHLPVLDRDGRVLSIFTLSDILHLHLAGTVDLADIATRLVELPASEAAASPAQETAPPAKPEPVRSEEKEEPARLASTLEFKSGGPTAAASERASIPAAAKPVRTGRPAGRSPVEKHRNRTLLEKLQRAYFRNRGLTVIVSVIAIVTFFAGWLMIKILGLFDVYQASHYEPKDTERQQMLEKKQ